MPTRAPVPSDVLSPVESAGARPREHDRRRWRRDPEDAIVGAMLAAVAVVALGPVPALVPAVALAVTSPMLWRADVLDRRLPNALVYPCALLAAVALTVSVVIGRDSFAPLVATLLTGLFFGVLSVGGGMGMGDVKLAIVLATVLALVRMDAVVLAAVVAFVSGGIAGVVVRVRAGARSIPFGPFLLLGFWSALVVAG